MIFLKKLESLFSAASLSNKLHFHWRVVKLRWIRRKHEHAHKMITAKSKLLFLLLFHRWWWCKRAFLMFCFCGDSKSLIVFYGVKTVRSRRLKLWTTAPSKRNHFAFSPPAGTFDGIVHRDTTGRGSERERSAEIKIYVAKTAINSDEGTLWQYITFGSNRGESAV